MLSGCDVLTTCNHVVCPCTGASRVKQRGLLWRPICCLPDIHMSASVRVAMCRITECGRPGKTAFGTHGCRQWPMTGPTAYSGRW